MAKNKNNKPQGGIYEGDAGAVYAKDHPLEFYNFSLANEGRTGFNTAPDAWNYLQNQGFNNIFNQYNNALGGNEDLQFTDHMANTYGASRTPTAANPFFANSALAPVVVDQTYTNNGGRRRRRRR